MIFKLAWSDFESILKTIQANPGNEGSSVVQPILAYYSDEERVSLYFPLNNVIYSSTLLITDFADGNRFESVEAFKLEILRHHNAIQVIEDPEIAYKPNITLKLEQS